MSSFLSELHHPQQQTESEEIISEVKEDNKTLYYKEAVDIITISSGRK